MANYLKLYDHELLSQTTPGFLFATDIEGTFETSTETYTVRTHYDGEDAFERFVGWYLFTRLPRDALREAIGSVIEIWTDYQLQTEAEKRLTFPVEPKLFSLALGEKKSRTQLRLEE